MHEVNWGNFKAKFNGREQDAFERLCYLLFCCEFHRPLGIFRYKNQAGIETEPIEWEGKHVGFQAKFFETSIDQNKEKLKNSIRTAKAKNEDLDRILFYVYQEFSESSVKTKKAPVYKTEIESFATSLSIEIEWRVTSHLEAQLASEENKHIAAYFFNLGKSAVDLVGDLAQHTEAILTPIRSAIAFHGSEIKIDRSQTLDRLKETRTLPLIVVGSAGVGKTAIIKDFYESLKDHIPCYVFKATEFNILHTNNLFASYGPFTVADFLQVHEGDDCKYVVIDSAEALSDIERKEAFQEFLVALMKAKWTVVFTTRHRYFDDLKFQLLNVFSTSFQPLMIPDLSASELIGIAQKHRFTLPPNNRLTTLLQIPFYLGEFLKLYDSIDRKVSYKDFKNILWDQQIARTSYRGNNEHIKRADCFIEIALKRAASGHYFIGGDSFDSAVLNKLETDEIIKYDSGAAGYFITHDIYEEWALERVIERAYRQSEDHREFFKSIPSSLPIRRAFRSWIAEYLLDDDANIKTLIKSTMAGQAIANHWRDEVCVATLLSDYSQTFVDSFEDQLLADDQKLLLHLIVLLRTCCKDVDLSMLHLLGLAQVSPLPWHYIFTQPKGSGWDTIIALLHRHRAELGLKHLKVVLPLLKDWTTKSKNGETTKQASQLALYYYDEIASHDAIRYSVHDELTEQMIGVILSGASEIKDELKLIFDLTISENQTSHRDPYYAIMKTILTSILYNAEVIKAMPEYIIQLADLFWTRRPRRDGRYDGDSLEVERDFGLTDEFHMDYFPSSALQTPIWLLLQSAPDATVEFIVSFVNRAVDHYRVSQFSNEVEQIVLHIDEKTEVTQCISNRLWCAYRGNQVSTHVLESMHMALEKWLLETVRKSPKEVGEEWCLRLLKDSHSASLTAVVASVVQAYPSKLFKIACVLFRTKELFHYDTVRMLLDQQQKGSLLGLRASFGSSPNRQLYEDERIAACDDAHRKQSLEQIALSYQVFATPEDSEGEVLERQETLGQIFDHYYSLLPDSSQETDTDRTWRLCLARMDRRKMTPEVKELNGQTLVMFKPEVDSALRQHSEESLQKNAEAMKYVPLRFWSQYRFENKIDKYSEYEQYESNPKLALSEARQILDGLRKDTDKRFALFNQSIPAYVCAVLVRDHYDLLDEEERQFCKEVIIATSSIPFAIEPYDYQAGEGTEPAICVLPHLIQHFPQETSNIQSLLIFLLFYPYRQIAVFAIRAVLTTLWKADFDSANQIFLAYLLLSPKYQAISKEVRHENMERQIWHYPASQIRDRFLERHGDDLERILSGNTTYNDVRNLDNLPTETLVSAFELLPPQIVHEDHRTFVNALFSITSVRLFQNRDSSEYSLWSRFLEKTAYVVLNSSRADIEVFLKPFVDHFKPSDTAAQFFYQFVMVEDQLGQYEAFWTVWNFLYKKVAEVCKTNGRHYATSQIVRNFLFAGQSWREDAKKWHSLQEREALFFKRVADELSESPSVLYSIAKLLNGIGGSFIHDGIDWISTIIGNNAEFLADKLETNTIFYIENLVRRYVLMHRQSARTSLHVKHRLLTILDFLVERGSTTGYLLREDIL